VHICCLAFREPPASGGGGGALKCLCELSARDEVFRQRTYLYGLYRLYLSDAAARAAQPVRAEADGGAEAAPPTQDRTSAAAAPDVPGAVPGAGGEAGVMGGAAEADSGDGRGGARSRRQARRQRAREAAGPGRPATPQAVEAWLDERLLAGQADILPPAAPLELPSPVRAKPQGGAAASVASAAVGGAASDWPDWCCASLLRMAGAELLLEMLSAAAQA